MSSSTMAGRNEISGHAFYPPLVLAALTDRHAIRISLFKPSRSHFACRGSLSYLSGTLCQQHTEHSNEECSHTAAGCCVGSFCAVCRSSLRVVAGGYARIFVADKCAFWDLRRCPPRWQWLSSRCRPNWHMASRHWLTETTTRSLLWAISSLRRPARE